MAKVNERQKERMLILIKQMTIANKTVQNIRDEVHKVLGVDYCLKSILNYRTLAFEEEYIAKLKEENEIMKRWLKQAEIVIDDPNNEAYAENLYLLAKHKLSLEDFENC